MDMACRARIHRSAYASYALQNQANSRGLHTGTCMQILFDIDIRKYHFTQGTDIGLYLYF